jgi:hypothetical protein
MFCTPEVVFDGTEGVWSCFHVLRSLNCFRRCRGCRVSFSCVALPDSFSAVPRAFGRVFMFCAPGRIFTSNEGVGSHFHVLHARTNFRRYRRRQVPFSCFAIPDSFSTVWRASGLVFVCYDPGLVYGGTEGVGLCFHVLRSRTHFRRYRWRRVSFSCFARPNSFSAVPTASGPVFMFCSPERVFDGVEGVGTRFQVLRSRTCFRLLRGRRVPFACFARPDSISAVPKVSGRVFMFYALELFFGETDGVWSRFYVLRSRTCFRRYGGPQVSFSCFALPNSFSVVSRASCPVFMFCMPVLIFDAIEGVGYRYQVLRSRTRFR